MASTTDSETPEPTATDQAKSAIDRAIALLCPPPAPGTPAPAGSQIQASHARAVLDQLVGSDPEQLLSGELNLRHMTQSLFDWHGTKRSTKPLLHAFHNALQVPGRYDHAVELTAFLSALSPLLEPDRLARLYTMVEQVQSVYAPVRYTVSLSNKLQHILGSYPQARIEQLAQTMWIDSHAGRWWDMTDGIADADIAAPADEDIAENPVADLIETGRTPWTIQAADEFAALPYNKAVHEVVKRYVKRANSGADVDPDLSVLAAKLTWLPILDRPESPITPLINTLQSIRDTLGDGYECPDKPKRFGDLFPDVRIYGEGVIFPFHRDVLRADRFSHKGVRFELVRTVGALQENRTFMGNCTWSYKSQMEKGTYALYRLHYGDHIYNAAMRSAGGRWTVGEINSRFNRGNVPTRVRTAFTEFVANMSRESAVEAEKGSEAAALRIRPRFSVI
jgi:hypothetical protein